MKNKWTDEQCADFIVSASDDQWKYQEALDFVKGEPHNILKKRKNDKDNTALHVAHIKRLTEAMQEVIKLRSILNDRAEEILEYRMQIRSMTLSMNVHPDCTEGSEFDDLTSIAQDLLDKYPSQPDSIL
jgi:hypothetical protein